MSVIELDQLLLADFIVESRELLEEFSANVIVLEDSPNDMDVIAAVFRAAHTLKGSSAFFNLTHIKTFAHKLENLLDDLRNRKRTVTAKEIDFLLSGANHLKAMFDRISSGDYGTEFSSDEDLFLTQLIQFVEQEKDTAPVSIPEDIITHIQSLIANYKITGQEPGEVIGEIEKLLAPVDFSKENAPSPSASEYIAGQERLFFYEGVDLTEPIGSALRLMEDAAASGNLDDASFDDVLTRFESMVDDRGLTGLKGPLDVITEDFRAIRVSGIEFDELLTNMIKEKLDVLVSMLTVSIVEPEEQKDEATAPEAEAETGGPQEPKAAEKEKTEKIERKTMRIDEDKVDGFMSYVGELIVTSESFNYLQKLIEKEKVNPRTVRAFKNANQAFRELSDELQESLMEIRRVPIKGLLQKVNMMTRELSHQMAKNVRVRIEGQEVQLDKSIAENLEGPLVHVVRNSMDHGLEPPEEREAVGKDPEGTLMIVASSDKEFFYLEVSDDGRGIDPVKMKQAAMTKGFMSEKQVSGLSDKEAINLVFHAGFSTAKEITDVSGRGVGMDVVRNNINNLNGSIQLDSIPGQGTTISLKIPLSITLQVVKALLVRVGSENFIISLDDIIESVRPAPQDLSTVEGRGEIVNRRGKILPLIRLYEVFGLETSCTHPSESILVIVETPRGRYALMVDEVLGQQQVVVKELDGQFKKLSFLAGSATLGDGRLGLVLDTQGVIKLAQGGY